MPSKVEPNGTGGTLNVTLSCSGCDKRIVNFRGSALVEGSKWTVVGLALAIAFFVTGHGYVKFSKTLRQCLGISCISKNPSTPGQERARSCMLGKTFASFIR